MQTFYTPELQQQAEQMIENCWDWHSEAVLPEGYVLAAYPDGIFVCYAGEECDMGKFVKIECITEKSWS